MITKAFPSVLIATLSFLVLSGCSSMDIKSFDAKLPVLTPETYFLGNTFGQGQFYDRFARIQTTFTVQLSGKPSEKDPSVFLLDEVLTYESGESSARTFEIKKISDHQYEVRCPDIVGVGTITAYGNALQWKYKLKQKIGASVWTLSFDDWMFLKDDNLVLNRAKASKFGLELGEVFMVVSKK